MFDPGLVAAFVSVVVIDVALAGDNAIAVAMAAAALPARQRRRVIIAGTIGATAFRIVLATVAMRLLAVIGLTLAGGVLLLFVAWKLFRELSVQRPGAAAVHAPREKRFAAALFQVLAADISMSLDNVLAIAGAAREHFAVLVAGLVLSVALMGLSAGLLARLIARQRWISWVGLAVVTAVALRLIWDGTAELAALGG
ncbi:MAG TPA: YjbE family putative metal transport protein [Stellaceae bacterium]|nr:YjbE family putative metal transport protein [Stellaceae bacterium]